MRSHLWDVSARRWVHAGRYHGTPVPEVPELLDLEMALLVPAACRML